MVLSLSLVKEAVVNLESNIGEKIKTPELNEKDIIADLHIHSRYSRATSKNLSIDNLVKWARVKGINLLGTGDISHEEWLKEIGEKLVEDKEKGIYWYSDNVGKFAFVLSGEISLVFTSLGKGRRVHLVYLVPNLQVNAKINQYLDSKGRRDYDGRPIFSISCEEFTRKLKEIDSRIEIIPAHAWTPWFGVFGSESGFDSLRDAFGKEYERINAIETGMSSDPEMNWKIKELEEKAIISFSDSHSFWPWRLGREATIFNSSFGVESFSFNEMIKQIKEKTYKSTIETDPGYGKYHYDGHRLCGFSCSPQKTKELNGICPVCKKELVIGVENRVEKLSNNKNIPKNAKPFFKILPLHELIAFAINSKVESKKTLEIYNKLIERFGNEINILLRVDRNLIFSELAKLKLEKLGELIIDNRIANLKVQPGFDGEYGKLVDKDKKKETQITL